MDFLFWMLLGGVITFIAIKTIEINRGEDKPDGGFQGGAGGTYPSDIEAPKTIDEVAGDKKR